jgi:hypothetical protein
MGILSAGRTRKIQKGSQRRLLIGRAKRSSEGVGPIGEKVKNNSRTSIPKFFRSEEKKAKAPPPSAGRQGGRVAADPPHYSIISPPLSLALLALSLLLLCF